ncbi:hypothetical protein QQF64_029243 [Cirrhinus molitorella]|uniref:Uncharacterized protein n=1 Tax=Cirrhinus molitorella TaxID=172907 RepID=A0ABR3N9F9_9TELE
MFLLPVKLRNTVGLPLGPSLELLTFPARQQPLHLHFDLKQRSESRPPPKASRWPSSRPLSQRPKPGRSGLGLMHRRTALSLD